MEQDETSWLRILDFQERLRIILERNEPAAWPSANWIYEQLTLAIHGDAVSDELSKR